MQQTSEPAPIGILLLSHPEQMPITQEEMAAALPASYQPLPRVTLDLDMMEAARLARRTRDWSAAQRELEERVRSEVRPLCEKHAHYRVVYFGSSPVPLAIHLGFLLETWQRVEVIPHHHAQRTWGWVHEPGRPPARLAAVRLPDCIDRTEGEVVIRVSTSHRVDPAVTRLAVPNALEEIDISLEEPAEDAFSSLEEMLAVAQAFRETLDRIGDNFPRVRRVHLFAAAQPGIALLLGAQISKTMHPAVQTYQYMRNAEAVFHVPALLINGPTRPAPPPLSASEEAAAGRDRELLGMDLERMKGFALREQGHRGWSWIASVLSRESGHPAFIGPWSHLPALHETPLQRTSLAVDARTVDDSFRLVPAIDAWQVDDRWLARLARRIESDPRRQRALRMLVLHELAHRGPQALTSKSSQGIGRFPKVLEEMDYHADVWAMLYEYALTEQQAPGEVRDVRRFFMDLVMTATQTMWVFDDDGPPLQEIQIRRLNRYLIWYWQYLLIERGAQRGAELTLEGALALLAQRPFIELAGPTVVAHDERVYFQLDATHVVFPEIGIYHEGKLYRHGARIDFPIGALLEGVRTRDGEKILDVLRAVFEQTVR